MWITSTYLTDVMELSLTRAAGITNIWKGMTLIMQIGFAYLVDTILTIFRMLSFSSIVYNIGLWLLSMSTPPFLYRFTGTCRKYEKDCIGQTQKVLFYIALALIAIGMSAHTVSLSSFLKENNIDTSDGDGVTKGNDSVRKPAIKKETKSPDKKRSKPLIKKRLVFVAVFVAVVVVLFLNAEPWSIRFGVPAAFSTLATIMFFIFSRNCKNIEPEGSPITNVFGVFVAASSVRRLEEIPDDPSLLYETTEPHRLHVVRSHDLTDKPDGDVPMSIFWTVPQYILLGGLISFFRKSLHDFFSDQGPPSMKRYFDIFTKGIEGLGLLASVLCAYVVGKISEIGEGPNWFQPMLNKSRLANYYWALAGVSAVNLLFYIIAARCYPYRELASDGEGSEEEQDLELELA